ncbi:MAG TPA: ABC transporter permease, partial [Pseudonocardiaceae bacterium]|nr:ABC transporter permease [Pseudonocardiaceae bacterium]
MNWWETLRTSVDAIRSHRLRSGLTMLGILIGIAAVILTVGLGEGAQAQVSAAINSLGTNLLVISPGSSTTSGVRGGAGTASTLTVDDAAALSSHTVAPDIAGVAPTTTQGSTLENGTTNWTTSVVGTTPAWLSVRARTLAEGRFLTSSDVSGEAAVTVLGATTAQELFGFTDPVGRTVNIGSTPFTVVGVLASAGASSAQNEDDQAVVPISTAADRLIGGQSRTSVQSIYVEAATSDSLSAAYQEADAELLNLHHITTPTGADFTINSQQSLLST